MSSTTPILGLKTFNTTTDASSLVNTYINDVSGSVIGSNLDLLDNFANNVIGGSYISGSAGINVSGSKISLTTTGVISGSYNTIEVDSYGRITSASLISSTGFSATFPVVATGSNISLTTAPATQVSSGSSSEAVVSASSLSQSNYGKKTCFIPLNTSTALAGTETNFIEIPSYMAGWLLVAVSARCGAPDGSGSSTSGSPNFVVNRCSASSMTQVALLSSNITIDQGEFSSTTSTSPGTISTTACKILAGDTIWASPASASLCGTGVTYSGVGLTFQNKP